MYNKLYSDLYNAQQLTSNLTKRSSITVTFFVDMGGAEMTDQETSNKLEIGKKNHVLLKKRDFEKQNKSNTH